MTTRVLVVSSVHPPDDPRIRHKLVESLRRHAEVTLAITTPGPADHEGFAVRVLSGGRLRRSLAASRLVLAGGYDVISVHDPELLPAAVVSGMLGRRIVFDLHEDFPAQLAAKRWMPRRLRPLAAWAARGLLRLAEMIIEVTLAEAGYARRFRRPHPVFPNYLADNEIAPVAPADRHGVVYLGDITTERGLLLAVEALGHSHARPPLTLIGRCSPELRTRLEAMGRACGVALRFTGFLPPREALELVAAHVVGISPLTDHPNYRHSLPTKLLEYLALGVPVVASDLPGSRQVVADLGGVVWVAPSDAVALGDGIDTVLATPAITDAAVAGADGVRQRFRWPTDEVRRYYLG